MPESTQTTSSHGAAGSRSQTVVGATAEAAVAEVHARFGPEARIVDARRSRTGGVAGFFAKEVVELDVLPSGIDGAGAEPAESAASHHPAALGTPSTGVSSPVDRLLADALHEPETVDFATFLRRSLHTADADARSSYAAASTSPATASPTVAARTPDDVAPSRAEPAATPSDLPRPTPPGPSAPRPHVRPPTPPAAAGPWSHTALLHLGLPVDLVRSLHVGRDADDVAWTTALAKALEPSCRPLPTGEAVMVGPEADRVTAPGSVVTARSQMWLEAVMPGRWVHLVVGGDGWRRHLAEDPLAVSWATVDDLPEAVRCAVELGLVLGFGPLPDGRRRAGPLDVALAVRHLLTGVRA